jgi:hypothetical protein
VSWSSVQGSSEGCGRCVRDLYYYTKLLGPRGYNEGPYADERINRGNGLVSTPSTQ